MPEPFEFEFDFTEMVEYTESLSKSAGERFEKEFSKAFKRIGSKTRAEIVDRGFSGAYSRRNSSGNDRKLKNRSGNLSQSFDQLVTRRGNMLRGLELRVFTSSPYARVHELGTIGAGGRLPDIVPIKGKFLTIPMPAVLNPSGIPEFTARELIESSLVNTFFFNSAGNDSGGGEDSGLFLVEDLGNGDLNFLYRLVRKVAIKPRLGARKYFNSKEARKFREEEYRAAIVRAFFPKKGSAA